MSNILQIPVSGSVNFSATQDPVVGVQVELAIEGLLPDYFIGVAVTDSTGFFNINITDPLIASLVLSNSAYIQISLYANGIYIGGSSSSATYNGMAWPFFIDSVQYNNAIAGPTGTDAHYTFIGNVLITETGAPIPNALIRVVEIPPGLLKGTGFTDNEGHYGILGLSGIDNPSSSNPQYVIFLNGTEIYYGPSATPNIHVAQAEYDAAMSTIPTPMYIGGAVTIEETGAPVPNGRIDILLPNYGILGSGTTGSDGSFEIPITIDTSIDSANPLIFHFSIYKSLLNAEWENWDILDNPSLMMSQSYYNEMLAGYKDNIPPQSILYLSGQITFTQTGLPIVSAEVDIVDSTMGYGTIGIVNTDNGGNFTLTVTDPVLANLIGAQLIVPTYNVSIHGASLLSVPIPYPDAVQLNIDQSVYDAAVPVTSNTLIGISGNVKNGSFAAVGVNVNIYQSGFRQKVLLNSTGTDLNGNYKTSISIRNLNNITAVANPSLVIEATGDADATIASSGDVFNVYDGMQVNLALSADSTFSTDFDNLLQAVQTVVGPADIGSLTVDPDTATDEISYVNNAIGRTGASVDTIVKAHQYSTATALSPSYFYALTQTADGNRNPLLNLTASQITGSLTVAASNKIISAAPSDITGFVTSAQTYQVTATTQLSVTGETYQVNDALKSFLPSDTDVNNFLTLYNSTEYTDTADFWTAYTETYGPTMAQTAQTGLQVAAIAGFQPQIMSNLATTIGTGHVSQLAAWNSDTWLDMINTVCSDTGTLCVPAAIRGDSTDPDDTAVKTQYAQVLTGISKNMYPLTSINVDLQGSDGHMIISDGATRSQVVTFIGNNPSFDLRQDSIHDIISDNPSLDLSGVTDIASVQAAMAPMQRMLRVTGGTPDAVSQMISTGVGSARAISQMSQQAFVSAYSDILGSNNNAAVVHARAVYTDQYTTHTLVDSIQAARNNVNVLPGMSFPSSSSSMRTSDTTIEPDLSTLFGSIDYCACDECLSLYSPAAYLADTLNFIKTTAPSAFTELLNRRGDIAYIDLSCKNTNTSMPYIDLVNELLELFVLKSMGTASLPQSFQTNGTEAELAAYPEHTIKSSGVYVDYGQYANVYSATSLEKSLGNTVYPGNLPFSLALEEARSYLQYLGYSRYQMMELFTLYQERSINLTDEITSYSLFCEWLSITQASSNIITGVIAIPPTPWLYYGFSSATVTDFQDPEDHAKPPLSGPWDILLCGRIDVLLKQINITYKELLQFLGTRFINPGGYITITTNADATNPDTCALNELMLLFSDPANIDDFLNKLHRFVRLYRSGKLTIIQWDILFTSFDIEVLDRDIHSENGSSTDFELLSRAVRIAEKLNLAPELLPTWWSYADTHNYLNYDSDNLEQLPSVYQTIFSNRAVINDPSNLSFTIFSDPTLLGTYTYIIDSIPLDNTANIASFCRIGQSDVIALLEVLVDANWANANMDLWVLSRIYIIGQLSITSGFTVSEILTIINLCGVTLTADYVGAPNGNALTYTAFLENLELLTKTIDVVKISTFTLSEYNYLINNVDEEGVLDPTAQTIELFYEALRTDLKKFPLYDPASSPSDLRGQLTNVVYQHFTGKFSINSQWVQDIIDPSGPSTGFTLQLIDPTFTTSVDPIDEVHYPDMFLAFRHIYKSVFIASELKLTTADFEFFYKNGSVTGFQFSSIPVTNGLPLHPGDVPSMFTGLLCISRWVQVRNAFSFPDDGLATLLGLDYSTADIAAKQSWLDFWGAYTSWPSATLTDLVGDASPDNMSPMQDWPVNLLRTGFPANFAPNVYDNINMIFIIDSIVRFSIATGLSAYSIHAVLYQDIALDDSHKILFAAKGTKTDDEWSGVAGQLRDVIRRKQRDALVGFALANPPAGNKYAWQNVNDLYAYLMIDTQMEPVMLTSRIKQATSTVQLYVDRLLMNLEYAGGNPAAPLFMPLEATLEWKQWRKWYSVWEPNRQIFLYPENFMEPELRDDKTTFFEDLEAQLLQEPVTADNAEEAIRQYLYAFEDVARLEPVGVCDDTDAITGQPIKYIFGRTYSAPHTYYSRRLEGDIWTRWEKIDIDISSEHVLPFVWNSKLYLFWLTFNDKKAPVKDNATPFFTGSDWFNNNLQEIINEVNSAADQTNVVYYQYIDITLNWSEFKNGAWLKHKSAKETLTIKLSPDVLAKFAANFNVQPQSDYYNVVSKNRTLSLVEIIESRFYLVPALEWPDNVNLVLIVLHPNDMDDYTDESGESLHAFVFEPGTNEPRVWDAYTTINMVAPSGTVFRNMQFVATPSLSGSTSLYQDTIEKASVPYYVYLFNGPLSNTPQSRRATQQLLLNQNPYGNYSVVTQTPSGFQTSSLGDTFFYFDKQSTFFVTQKPVPAPPPVSTQWTLSLAGIIASGTYSVAVNSGFSGGRSLTSPIPVNTTPPSVINVIPNTTLTTPPVAATTYYDFQAFYHPMILNLTAALDTGGVDNLLQLKNQPQSSSFSFASTYQPNSRLLGTQYPTEIIDFSATGAYSQYNWEIFFHIPMLIAQRLSSNQQFDDAQKWFHYIFDPTSNVDGITGNISSSISRFWKFWPFYNQSLQPVQSLSDLLDLISQNNQAAVSQLTTWEQNAFDPFAIARIRTLAFMKNVVMKYIDNLIAWGDYLFTQDTLESINEATQLYVLASNILGSKPVEVSRYTQEAASNFNDLASSLDLFSNAAVSVENYVNLLTGSTSYPFATPPVITMEYFCLPDNDQLLAYWDTVADRLFKIRNSENIAGQFQQLPLFEPPINPELLVRAAAAGVDISSIVNDQTSVNLPNYRFTYIIQKANELCSDVKNLGSALLSALEKQDAENMALLRSGLELTLLNSMLQMKQLQLNEANANLDVLNASMDSAQLKYTYYSTRPYTNDKENAQLIGLTAALVLQAVQSSIQAASVPAASIPQFHAQAGMAIGGSYGGQQISSSMQAASTLVGMAATIGSGVANIAGISASFDRRMDEWTFQAQSAQKEITQVQKQIVAAEIRIAIAQNDLDSQQIQIDNNRALDDFMRTKYTNADLYNWMVTQIATTYFQAYQLAYAYAKKAATCYDHELPFAAQDSSQFISFGYWDSLKKGLQSGEKLQLDLRKLEAAYIDNNIREFELTKHISLALLDPENLIKLRETGSCVISLPEWLFDLDYPGHYMRRIKSVSISIPCVAGPYTTVACQLLLNNSYYEVIDSSNNRTPSSTVYPGITIASSSAQNDSGLFELNFKDERYLPFEGYGAISNWTLTLSNTYALRQFDYNTISDIVLHMKYTAQYNSAFDTTNQAALIAQFIGSSTDIPLPRYFSLKHEFPNEWFQYINAFASDDTAKLSVEITADQFPFFAQGRSITITKILLQAGELPSATPPYAVTESVHTLTATMAQLTGTNMLSGNMVHGMDPALSLAVPLSLSMGFKTGTTPVDIDTVFNDLYMVVEYQLS